MSEKFCVRLVEEVPDSSPRSLKYFTSPQIVSEDSHMPTLVTFCLFSPSHPRGRGVVFIYISLRTNNVEHLFHVLLLIRLYS